MGKAVMVVISLLAPLVVWLAVEAFSPSVRLDDQQMAKRRLMFLWSTVLMSGGVIVIAAIFPQ